MTQSARIYLRPNGVTLIAALALMLVLTCPQPAAASMISLVPSSTTAVVGEMFSLDIVISDAVPDVFAYQLDIGFNASLLRADSISGGGFLTSGGGISLFGGAFVLMLDNATGTITLLDSLLGPVPPGTGAVGSGLLATINFFALAPGASGIGLSNLILEDSSGNLLAADTTDGHVDVTSATPVPEPGTSSLMILGLACLWRNRRARKGHGAAPASAS